MISNEIQDAIKKNLPNMVATELQDFIKKALETAEILKNAQNRLAVLEKELEGCGVENARLKVLELTSSELDGRKQALDDQERNMKVTLADMRAAAAENKAEALYNIAHGLVRNTEYKKNLQNIQPMSHFYNNGSGGISSMIHDYQNKTGSTEEAV